MLLDLHEKSPYEGFDHSKIKLDLQGWGSEDQVFEALIKAVKPKVIVEVGSWKGASAIHMAKLCTALGLPTKIICVDTWLGSAEHHIYKKWRKDLKFSYGYPQLYFTFLSNVIKCACQNRIIPLPATSGVAFEVLKKKGIRPDLIYIDASHSYAAVLNDLRMYWELLSDNGVLFGDDYLQWGDVTRAVDSFRLDWPPNHNAVDKYGKFVIPKGPFSFKFTSRDKDGQLVTN
jgi:predicted O-methyltransferase YrrM